MTVLFTAPGDFTDASGTLTITEDDSEQCVTITIIDDMEDEDDRECFALAISTSTTDSISLDTTQATICINDNDGKFSPKNHVHNS